jgi:signal transduction histidine kinase
LNRLYSYIVLFCAAFLSWNAVASDLITLTDRSEEHVLSGSTIEVLRDSTNNMTFEEVINQYTSRPASFSIKEEQVNDPKAAFWLRIRLKDISSGGKKWLLELYDNRLDDIVLYIPLKDGSYQIMRAGDQQVFAQKDFQHINFVFQLPTLSSEESVLYIRLHSDHEIFLYGLIRTVQRYVAYTTQEYFYVAVFYGVLLALAIYNLLMLIAVRDRDYSFVYYFLYVSSTAFYALSRDGMGFQFVWPNFPAFNYFAEPLGLYCIAIALLFYARSFLNTRLKNPVLDKLILLAILIRSMVFIIGLLISGQFTRNLYLDFPLMLLAYVSGFVSYKKGFKAARYYTIGFTFLFIDFCIMLAEAFGLVLNGILEFYSFNIAVVVQFLVLSIALGDRVRLIIREKNEVQEKLIIQLQAQEAYKDQINLELEEKVRVRTLELEEKNTQLDSFVYKASHDIKGPLRSLMGLTKVGLVDFATMPDVAVYFQHIMKTSTKLDVILEDLLTVTKLKTSQLQKSEIDIHLMMKDILDTFHHLVGFNKLEISMDITGGHVLVSDPKVLYSILQNLTENAIKYYDEEKDKSWLKVSIEIAKKEVNILFQDNGSGINEIHLKNIFDMFYKVNDKSIGSGLGLYILKQAVHKLSGTVTVSSVEGEGSVFTIVIPNG